MTELEKDVIAARIQSKLEYLDDTVRKLFHPFVKDIAETIRIWNERIMGLESLQAQERLCGSHLRRVERLRIGFIV